MRLIIAPLRTVPMLRICRPERPMKLLHQVTHGVRCSHRPILLLSDSLPLDTATTPQPVAIAANTQHVSRTPCHGLHNARPTALPT